MRLSKLASVCGVLWLGCGDPRALVRTRAASDFACDPASLHIEQRNPLWLASGCGKQNAYGTTGEWGVTWAVPCDRGSDAGVPRPPSTSAFDAAPPDACSTVLGR